MFYFHSLLNLRFIIKSVDINSNMIFKAVKKYALNLLSKTTMKGVWDPRFSFTIRLILSTRKNQKRDGAFNTYDVIRCV